jgi:NIMA (never in mitosis gene a)-related kinase
MAGSEKSKILRGVDQILLWVEQKATQDRKKAQLVCQRLMDKKLISCVYPLVTKFRAELHYEFYFNSKEVPANLHKTWDQPVSDALKVSLNLIEICQQLLNAGLTPDRHKEVHYLDVDAALKSAEFKTYKNEVCQQQKVNIMSLNHAERASFFLNVYQCMYFHYYLQRVQSDTRYRMNQTFVGQVIGNYVYDTKPKRTFFYIIGGLDFNLNDLKHGILRQNKRVPGTLFAAFSAKDHRANILQNVPILFVTFIVRATRQQSKLRVS